MLTNLLFFDIIALRTVLIMNEISIAQSIKILCAYKNINITQLGKKLNKSKENFHAQIKRDKFQFKDIVKIADILGYDVKLQFVDRATGKIIDVEN